MGANLGRAQRDLPWSQSDLTAIQPKQFMPVPFFPFQLLLKKDITGWGLRPLTGSGFRISAVQWMSSVASTRSQLGGTITGCGAFARHAGKRQPSPSIFDPVDCFHQSSTSLSKESTASVLS